MIDKKVWTITLGVNGITLFVASSKTKALDEIVQWKNSYTSPYRIDTDIDNIDVTDGHYEFIHITMFGSEEQVTLHIDPRELDNGADLIHINSELNRGCK